MLKNNRFTATSRPSNEETIVTQTQQMGNQEVTVTTHFDFNWDHVHFSVKVRTFRRRSITPHHHYYHHSPQLLSYQKYEAIMSDPDFRNLENYSGVDMTAYGFYKVLSNALKDVKFHYYQNNSNNTVTLAVAQGMVTIPMKMGELQDIITPTTSANNLENLAQTQGERESQTPIWRNPQQFHQNHSQQEIFHLNNRKNAASPSPSPSPSPPPVDGDAQLSALTEDLARHKSQYDTKISVIENQLSSMVQRLNTMDRSLSDIKSGLMDEFSKIVDQKIVAMVKSCPVISQTPVKNIQITKSKKQDLEPVLSTRSDSFYLSDLEEEKTKEQPIHDYAPWKNPESIQPYKAFSSSAIGSNVQIENHNFLKKYADVIKNSPYGDQIDLLKLWNYDTYKEYLFLLHQSERYTLAVTYGADVGDPLRIFLIHNYGGHVPEESLHLYRTYPKKYSICCWHHSKMIAKIKDLDAEYEGRLSSRMAAIRYYTALENIISAHFQ
jgi:hypothetical protein